MDYACHSPDQQRWFVGRVTRFSDGGSPPAVVAHETVTERRRAEEALRRSETKYRELVQNANSIILRMAPEGRITFINEFALAFFGYREDELLGRNVVGTIVPEIETSGRDLAQMIRDLSIHPERYAVNQNENMRRNGDRVWIAWTNKPLFDDHGNIAELLCVGNDITELKRMERVLREEKDRAQNYLDVASVVLVAIDADQRVTLINRKGCELLGWSEKEIIGKNWFDVAIPERLREEVRRVSAMLMAGEIEPVEYFENPVITREGTERVIAWHNTVLRDPAGSIVGTLSSGEDITERRRAEGAMRESEERYRSLFESSWDAMMTLEPPSWRFTSGNPSMLRMFKAKDEAEFTLHHPWTLSPDRQPDGRISEEKARERIETAIREGSAFFEWMHKRVDGNVFPAEVLLTRVERKGKTLLQATVRDIAARKQAEQALQQSENRFKQMSSPTSEGIMVHDGGIIMDANPAFAELVGYSNPESLVGKSGLEIIPFTPESRQRVLAH
jgi:PAS domain S-box-containing protein